jgi:uncharacterized Zn finger protein
MIMFTCNYCDHFEMIPYAGPGVCQRIPCQQCGKNCYLVHSNLDPVSYREEDVIVNETDKSIKFKTDTEGGAS